MDIQPDRCGDLYVTEHGSVRCAYPAGHPTMKDGKVEHYCCIAHVDGTCQPGHWTVALD